MAFDRSLQKDNNDSSFLHSPAWRQREPVRLKDSQEHVPMFFTRSGATLPLEGMYRGGHAFLMANGPSVGALDLTQLKRCWVMTLNNGHKTFRGNANCHVDDPSRFSLSMWLDPSIMKFTPMAHFDKNLWDNRLIETGEGWRQMWEESTLKVGDCPNVIGFRRNEKMHPPRWLNEETINWGNHRKFGGGRSVLLAALRIVYILGFRTVNLLGVDFRMSSVEKYHFEEERTPNSIKCNNETYEKMQGWFKELQPLFLKSGYHVRNCNPKSALEAFPFVDYSQAVTEALSNLGNVDLEQTSGMYQKLEAKKAEVVNRQDGLVPSVRV